jgi:hypothetical protein
VQITRCELKQAEVERLSSRTGQRHPLGGFVGEAEYEGELGDARRHGGIPFEKGTENQDRRPKCTRTVAHFKQCAMP